MSFLAPWYVPILAAGLTVPPLVLLYFLKLKRRDVPIASTLLWQPLVQDLQVSQPFQRLRKNLLLILQLLILLAAILALSEPMWAGQRRVGKALVLLIDHSASMGTDEGDGLTRLAIAKREAHKVIDQMDTDQRAMLITFADRATVLAPFTDDKETLRRRPDSIRQTDAAGRLTEATALAEAYSAPGGEGLDAEAQSTRPHYIVFTDGRLADAGEVTAERGAMDIVRVGRATENVGIVNLQVRRHYERPERLSVLARVRNFGAAPASRDISLYVDGRLENAFALPELEPLGPAEKLGRMDASGAASGDDEDQPTASLAEVLFEPVLETSASIEVRLSGGDAFSTDDRAYAVAASPRPIRVLLVTSGNRYLEDLLDAFAGGLVDHYDVWRPALYEDRKQTLIEDGRCRYDVVILDGHSTDRLPPGNYIFFGGVPFLEGVDAGEEPVADGPLAFVDWDETHSILRHVNVETITVLSWLDLKLPEQATMLIEGTDGPVLALLSRGRNQYLICAFGFFNQARTDLNTDWVRQQGIVAFMSNALRYLAVGSPMGQPPVAPGEAFTMTADPGATSVTVRRPDGSTEDVPAPASGLVAYGQTDRVGIYTIETGVANREARAVSLLDENESFIAPNEAFRIAGGEVDANVGLARARLPLWPYLLGALGFMLFVEWFVYNKRVAI